MEYLLISLFIHSTIFIFGIIIGSFLNVCIYRIPEQLNIVSERSRCRSCGSALGIIELIPILSFVLQRGHCRNCPAKLSLQYPIVEALNGLVYVLVCFKYGLSTTSLLYCLCASALIVIAIIDWRTFEIPAGLNIFIGILGIINLCHDYRNWLHYLLGFITVSGLLTIVYFVTKGNGIGGGDIKLMAVAGLLLGWQNIILALIIGSITGSIIHLILMKTKGKSHVLAFGPYLSFGIFTVMLYGTDLIDWYINNLF